MCMVYNSDFEECEFICIKVINCFGFHMGDLISQISSELLNKCKIYRNKYVCGHYQFGSEMFLGCYLVPFDTQW